MVKINKKVQTMTKLTEVKKNNLVVADSMFEQDAGKGSDQIRNSDVTIPRVKVLQALSAQLKKTKSEYIKEAKAGDICNAASNVLYDGSKGIVVIPVHFQTDYIEWTPVSKGGGLVKNHLNNESVIRGLENVQGRWLTKNGTEIIETPTYYVLVVDEKTGTAAPVVISMSGTNTKNAKKWNYLIKQIQLPKQDGSGFFNPSSFYNAYTLTAIPASNEKGEWYELRATAKAKTVELQNGTALYLQARSLEEMIRSGKAVAEEELQKETFEDDSETM